MSQTTLDVTYNRVTRNLPPDNDKYYIQQIPGSLTVDLQTDPSMEKVNIINVNNKEEEVQITKKKPQLPRDSLKSKKQILKKCYLNKFFLQTATSFALKTTLTH